jgi:hypothetical protein
MKKTGIKMMLVTLIVGIPAFFLGPVIWPPSPDIHPTQTQLPYLIVLSLIEALIFGFGVAFIIYGWPRVKAATGDATRAARAMYVSLAWLAVSWWPHDNLHIHNALNMNGLIAIEYAFHFTLIVAGLVLVYSFFELFKGAEVRAGAREKCRVGEPGCEPSAVHP